MATALSVACLLVLLLPASTQARPAADTSSSTTTSARASAKLTPTLAALLRKVNNVRAKHHLKPLKASVCLRPKFARPWAVHMAETETLVHQDLAPMFRKCKGFHRVGENIAAGYATAGSVMKAWMHSPGHRANILKKGYRQIGLGLASSDEGVAYWVQDFGG